MFAIRAGKAWIALLVLGLMLGLSRARNFPVWATLVGVTINLLMIAWMVQTVLRLKKNLN